MGKRGTTKVLVDERQSWTLHCAWNCAWVMIADTRIERESLKLADGREVMPGARVFYLGGKKTSAGYTRVDMLDGEWLVYLGRAHSVDGTLVLFDTREPKGYRVCYWWHEDALIHCTHACSGRVVELTTWRFENPPWGDWILCWWSGHDRPVPVYFSEHEGQWGATYERTKAKRFPSREAAEQAWLDKHAFPEEYRQYLEDQSTWAEQA